MKTITIDDNPSILNLMRFIMNKIAPEGSHFFVSSAEEGFSLIEREGIRIVFLDIEMPNISGIETAKFLNDKYRDIDVIFITGHTEYAMVGHKLHCSSFVTKPFDENDIAEALKWLRNPVKSEKVLRSGAAVTLRYLPTISHSALTEGSRMSFLHILFTKTARLLRTER